EAASFEAYVAAVDVHALGERDPAHHGAFATIAKGEPVERGRRKVQLRHGILAKEISGADHHELFGNEMRAVGEHRGFHVYGIPIRSVTMGGGKGGVRAGYTGVVHPENGCFSGSDAGPESKEEKCSFHVDRTCGDRNSLVFIA